jgi:23S rRNA G2445 N2-methylase RlmL
MKLTDHVNLIRNLIEKSFDKRFASLGIGALKELELEKIPHALHAKRAKFDIIIQNHTDETGSYKEARAKVLDELTFTLFNRIASIKVLEAHELIIPIITKDAAHGDRSFGHKAYLEENPHAKSLELEGLREFVKAAFNTLSSEFALYHKEHPYALLPQPIDLNEIIDAFNAIEKDAQVENNIWQSDDILGWLYESYNTAKKLEFKESGGKTEYDKVSLQSQVYTPKWVVEFLVNNSLGKLYLEMYPQSEIKNSYKIANAPHEKTRELKPLTEIKLIDPACGSGNFLLYAFDFFYALYLDQIENYDADYKKKDIAKLIIEHNLHGIDLDDRAIQIAQLGLYIKAKKRRANLNALSFSVVSSDFFLPPYSEVAHIFETSKLDTTQKRLVEEIWSDLQQAYKFGSLIKIGEKLKAKIETLDKSNLFDLATVTEHKEFEKTFFANLRTAVEQHAKDENQSFLSTKTADAIKYLEIITTKYDIATANPPYTDSSDFGIDLKEFIETNYKKPYKFNTNLYATFIKRCHELTNENGKIALIHPHTFMFIKTFKDVRKFMIDKSHIDLMVDFGLDRVNLFGLGILLDATFYVLSKAPSQEKGIYFSLTSLQEKYKKDAFLEALDDYIASRPNKHNYTLPQNKLKIIKSTPFIYWISDEFREKFETNTLSQYSSVALGLKTANNNKFLRLFWEVDKNNISKKANDSKKWVTYLKGGSFNKWAGNEWLVVEWENNGTQIKNQKNSQQIEKGLGFKAEITLSTRSIKGVCGRAFNNSCLFDMAASSIIPNDEKYFLFWLAYSNSKLFNYTVNSLNPTVNVQPEDIRRLPVVMTNKLDENARICLNIKKHLCSFSIIETNFTQNPLVHSSHTNLKERVLEYLNYENYLLSLVLLNEAIINEEVFKIYELSESDITMVLEKEGKSIGGLSIEQEAKEAFLSSFPSSSLGMHTAFSSTCQDFINSRHVESFESDKKAGIIKAFETLYQSNNDLEEFCIKHQVNPINVWHWFKESKTLPKQRTATIALEFLTDMVRELLNEDDDGIIPLVPNAGEKVLFERLHEKFYQKGFTDAQTSSFDSLLGKELENYLQNNFFKELSDHLNLFMYLPKTPFIWHLSSGEYKGFECYISIYKWSRDNLLRVKSVYIENRQRALQNRQLDLSNDNTASAQNEKDLLFKQLREIEEYKTKIDDLLANGYNPVLDSGVGKNIAPLQKAKMISYEVLNAGQLKKYLLAEW